MGDWRNEAEARPGGPADDERPVAVVMSGAGARGPYEAGALSVILPALGAAARPRWYVGTSAGAINAVAFAAASHLDAGAAAEQVIDAWRQVRQGDVFSPPAVGIARAGLRMLARGGAPRAHPVGLLDTGPLHRTLARLVNWEQLHVNVRHGYLDGCGVVVTEKSSHRTKVFLECTSPASLPEPDPVRGIVFERATLTPAHVVGSSSLPALFPAAELEDRDPAESWYVDGGVRLNTPMKPALMLGAGRLVVVATTPESLPAVAGDAMGRPPGVASGLVDVLRAVTEDRMLEDLRLLVRDNRRAAALVGAGRRPASGSPDGGGDPRLVQFVFAGPRDPRRLGGLAAEVLASRRRWSPPGAVARLVARSPDLSELASFLLFDRDFVAAAIELGREDARSRLNDGTVLWRCDDLGEAP